MYHVCVLRSEKDGKLYYGFTDNIKRRLDEHNSGGVTSTRSRVPLQLMYTEAVTDAAEARRREKYFKSGFGRKYVKNRIQGGPIV